MSLKLNFDFLASRSVGSERAIKRQNGKVTALYKLDSYTCELCCTPGYTSWYFIAFGGSKLKFLENIHIYTLNSQSKRVY